MLIESQLKSPMFKQESLKISDHTKQKEQINHAKNNYFSPEDQLEITTLAGSGLPPAIGTPEDSGYP